MQQCLEELERKLKEERRRTLLCSGLSIEIEQVACAVMLASEALEKEFWHSGRGGKAARPFRALDNSALRLARISENLNDLLACQQAQLTVRLQPVDLVWQYGRVMEQCLESGKVAEGQLEWNCALPEGQYVQADPLWVDKVLLNLLSNALRWGTKVQVELAAENDMFLLSVRDEGPGIDPLVKEHLFEPFVTDATPGKGGTGLGLCLAKEFCAALGWSLALESGEEGTLAKVLIPRQPASEEPVLNSSQRDLAFCSAQNRRVAKELSVLE